MLPPSFRQQVATNRSCCQQESNKDGNRWQQGSCHIQCCCLPASGNRWQQNAEKRVLLPALFSQAKLCCQVCCLFLVSCHLTRQLLTAIVRLGNSWQQSIPRLVRGKRFAGEERMANAEPPAGSKKERVIVSILNHLDEKQD